MQARGRLRRPAAVATTAVLVGAALLLSGTSAGAAAPTALPPGVQPVDAQHVANLDTLTWDDFHPLPGTNWVDPSVVPTVKKWKAAIVLVDYPDMPFQITEPEGSNIWGNPGPGGGISRDEVPQFYKDLLNTPQALNNYHTINEYWMEDTGGRYGVDITAFGAYQMPKNSYQYHYSSFANRGSDPTTRCPVVLQCNGNFRADALALWKAGTGNPNPLADFDNVFYIGAGEDQSSSWLEFGAMKFKTPQDVTDPFGPPAAWKAAVLDATGAEAPNWSPTRYVPWTAWASGSSMWPNASGNTSIEAESSGAGVYAHEFSHNLKIGDNYGNPYAVNPNRDQSGTWDMLSRGSFNGPGGPHQRWHVPSVEGAVMGSQHMLRDKMTLNFVDDDDVVKVDRTSLAADGLVLTNVLAREVVAGDRKIGINVAMNGGDQSTCESQGAGGDDQWRCDKGGFDNYTLEVVDQMGTDSFQPDSGVLLAKTKNTRSPNKWVIDANVADIDLVDYTTADGEQVKLTRGDHRQLNDALFKAGVDSGSQAEYTDAANGLQFYVLAKHRDAQGVLSYDLAVRATAGSGSQVRGAALGAATRSGVTPNKVAKCTFPLTNTGAAGSDPQRSADVYRLTAKSSSAGWKVWLPNELAGVPAGDTAPVSVYVTRTAGLGATVSVTATSESDPTKTATGTCRVGPGDTIPRPAG